MPVEVLFSGLTPLRLAHAVAVAAGLTTFIVWFWRRGLAAYSSASS